MPVDGLAHSIAISLSTLFRHASRWSDTLLSEILPSPCLMPVDGLATAIEFLLSLFLMRVDGLAHSIAIYLSTLFRHAGRWSDTLLSEFLLSPFLMPVDGLATAI